MFYYKVISSLICRNVYIVFVLRMQKYVYLSILTRGTYRFQLKCQKNQRVSALEANL